MISARLRHWFVALMAITACGSAEAARRPNIVVMLTDDQRWNAVGAVQRELGNRGRFPWMRTATPNMDRIAAEGFRFRNAFAVSSVCSPSRAAFLTGRYNHLNGIANNHTPFPLASVTYATLLRAAGYHTGYFGKWHMGTQRERPGFDRYASYVGQGQYNNAIFLVNGVKTSSVGWVDDITTTYAIEFMRANATRPFLAIIGFKSPHSPHTPPSRLDGMFTSAVLAASPNTASYAPYDPTPVPSGMSTETVRDYFRTLVGVDQNIGRILGAIDQIGVTNDTVVVFASDNGFFLREHGIPEGRDGNKRNAYEESIRIPLLLRYPRLARRGVVLDTPALNIDLAPTMLELAGHTRPTSIQGCSWVPLLTGQSTSLRTAFLYEYFFESGYDVPTIVSLRRDDYKLVHYPRHPAWYELFNLATDSYETRNLINDPGSQRILQAMNDALDAEMARTRYRVPPYADPVP